MLLVLLAFVPVAMVVFVEEVAFALQVLVAAACVDVTFVVVVLEISELVEDCCFVLEI